MIANSIVRYSGTSGLQTDSLLKITGVGAIQSAAATNNAEGWGAVDLQIGRTGTDQVANGSYAVMAGGYANKITNLGDFAFIGGGYGNVIGDSAYWSVVCGGITNNVTAIKAVICGGINNSVVSYQAFIGGGNANVVSGVTAVVVGGASNTASGLTSAVVGGTSNTASGDYSVVAGGIYNTASGAYSTVPGGTGNTASGVSSIATGASAKANKTGQRSHAAGAFAAAGDAQGSELVLRFSGTASQQGPFELSLDGAGQLVALPDRTAWAFQLLTVAQTTGTLSPKTSAWESKGVVRNFSNLSGAAFVGTPTTVSLGSDFTGFSPVLGTDLLGRLRVTFTGSLSAAARIVCYARLAEVSV